MEKQGNVKEVINGIVDKSVNEFKDEYKIQNKKDAP